MDRNASLGADSIDWADPAFSSSEFQDSMLAESPWGNSALNDFTNLADYSDSPAALGLRTPSKSGPETAAASASQQQPPHLPHSRSADSSSGDSASDSSGGRKRKTASESPMPNPVAGNIAAIKEESMVNADNYQTPAAFQQTFSQAMPRLAVDQSMSDGQAMFDFNSAASSPNLPRDFNQQLSLEATNNLISANAAGQYAQDSPIRTINPGMFTLGGSRDQSPATNSAMFNAASPNNFFSTPSSDSNEQFNANQAWGGLAANPTWPADLTNQFASPSGLNFTPSPVANGGTPSMASRGTPSRLGRTVLHIAPISAKSRVETQINVVMTLEKPPIGVEHLHLPLHTIAKSKLLAKEDYDPAKVLELHTMLVCSSAMHNPGVKEKALHKAASQNNEEIQQRAEREREYGDDEKNNMKNVEEADKPSNGGEVRICNNCIQRERKRAGRKKLKKEEEQQHWERYETERVVVFNSSEYLPFKPYEQRDQIQKDHLATDEPYEPPPGAISVSAAMRIACYCRHQSEKEGFQVIFTMKDHQGNVVAQEMSDSILITDDHKTHPSTLPQLSNDVYFQPSQMGTNGLPSSYSMVDLQSHAQPFTSSRSAGNLQALAFGGQQLQFNPHSHVHQLPGSLNTGLASQATSATMTPTNLSRPGSPTLAGQAGPNKKRKSGSFHKRLPSGLQMTPRVDTTQNPPQSATLSSGLTAGLSAGLSMANFSPTRGVFANANDPSFMTIPQSGGSYYGSGPSTPAANDNAQFQFGQPHQLDIARAQNSAYFSHPSSAVPSRSNSPVLQHSRLNMSSSFQRNPIQTPTNQLNRPLYTGQASGGAMSNENSPGPTPTITKITPNEGPAAGGTEVSIYGYNFTNNTQVLFGDTVAVTTTLYGSKSILAIAPPGRRGPVRVTVITEVGPSLSYSSAPNNNHVFTYTETNPLMMKMALQYLSQQQTGDPNQWQQYTTEVANQFMQTSISPAGIHGQGYGGDMFSCEPAMMGQIVLKILDWVDASEVPRQPCYDLRAPTGQTMLSLAASSGMHQVVAALLARGAHPDVRDQFGFTPLMHAALHERSKTFQLLLVKGADPTIRDLKGYAALDLVPHHSRENFSEILHATQRTRITTRPPFHRLTSNTSSKISWDLSSASFYDSDLATTNSVTMSRPISRRPSTSVPHPQLVNGPPESLQSASLAAMTAWRDTLAAQIHHFQHTVQSSMSHFQLPALSPLPDYQDNAMVRRLSSFVSSKCSDMFCLSPTVSTAPPPAYEDLFPQGADEDVKRRGVEAAVVDAVADQKCANLFQDAPECSAAPLKPSRAKNVDVLRWRLGVWMGLLVALTALVLSTTLVSHGWTKTFSIPPRPVTCTKDGMVGEDMVIKEVAISA